MDIGAPDGKDVPARKGEQVQSVIAPLQADELDMEQARLRINELLQMFSQIEWWGQADELLKGDSDFSRDLREWHRDFNRIWPADATPITAAESLEFYYALQVYGL